MGECIVVRIPLPARVIKLGVVLDEDLAAIVRCVRVNRFTAVLVRFKHTDAVTTCRKRIQITDRAQLERVVGQRSGPSP